MFTIHSNLTELASCATLNEAKDLASAESNKFDDMVVIRKNGYPAYFAQFGTIYSLRPLLHGRITAKTE